ncbi:MAG: low molecular weight protein-tyrosine-phosphatase [Sulfitobacter pontiacus]|uniref:protein-tyrosine-phosphatase n=1 Tax=Sulfitobacter litoralis TaxID=335975 RepID=A0ABY0SUB7_9RHOB|nr:low molecular weight protein-tyrosine-phosphatase [Sulfitobacter litoralis]SDP61756.1 protein-tyrosine phosphatase [Sulfitobacter litoralis]
MVSSILCVCTGNICRSPVAEAALREALPDVAVTSAGLHALVGRDINTDSAEAAREQGILLLPHAARQFTSQLGEQAELILVMDQDHRDEIIRRWPQFSGKTMLLGYFENSKSIPDPYRMGMGMHQRAIEMIRESVPHWVQQLAAMRG